MEYLVGDIEDLGVISGIDERTNLEEVDAGGHRRIIVHKGYASRHLYEIEKFVKCIEGGKKGGFIEEVSQYSGAKRIRQLYLGRYFYRLVNSWIERYSDVHRYSARVEVFYDACRELGMIGPYLFEFGLPGEIARADGARYMDAFDALIEIIRERCLSREFRESERLRRLNADRNKRKVLALEKEMFSEENGRSRWLVLSLTLRYQPQFRRWITPEVIQQHRDRFFAARRFNSLMSGVKNYAWAIEQGEGAGLHLHVMLFYSAKHNHDEYIARQICEYWTNVVTEGKGEYWNSNRAVLKKSYEKLGHGVGVGQINWDDAKMREALRTNLVYLAKIEQYVMIKGADRIRTFGTGKVPKRAKVGRPRSNAGELRRASDGSDEY
ncbi:inovirus-type Gp2 protein [Burkholderia gladioli]|uniref:inovirus-type Gp2 protein n=1 Tax=Burkholderia gladioli TaxID=28095 RepID=UPI001C24E363|nr:inovirus-type Gp2 protein [Burkholderia gladioli]MBU9169565.1 inovirus Gp2 family protein [Burkholderia gladioli]